MPSGRVKVFHADRKFGFVVNAENGIDLFVHAEDVPEGTLKPGDLIDFELNEDDDKPRARAVKLVKSAPEGSLVGHTMQQPPSHEELEMRERERRAARRRRR